MLRGAWCAVLYAVWSTGRDLARESTWCGAGGETTLCCFIGAGIGGRESVLSTAAAFCGTSAAGFLLLGQCWLFGTSEKTKALSLGD